MYIKVFVLYGLHEYYCPLKRRTFCPPATQSWHRHRHRVELFVTNGTNEVYTPRCMAADGEPLIVRATNFPNELKSTTRPALTDDLSPTV